MDLAAELSKCAHELDRVTAATKHRIVADQPERSVYEVLDQNGRSPLAPLLVARAQVLAALAHL
jgi:hypothetical protein